MAIWDLRPRGDILTGVAVGVAALAAPVVIPLAWAAVRPWLKALLKGGFLLYETGRGAYAEVAEKADGSKPKKATPIKVRATAQPAKETDEKDRIAALKTKAVEELSDSRSPEKPAAKKPRRQATKAKKKPEKKV